MAELAETLFMPSIAPAKWLSVSIQLFRVG